MIKLKISILFRRSETVLSVAERKNGLFHFLNIHAVAIDIVSGEISLDLLC